MMTFLREMGRRGEVGRDQSIGKVFEKVELEQLGGLNG